MCFSNFPNFTLFFMFITSIYKSNLLSHEINKEWDKYKVLWSSLMKGFLLMQYIINSIHTKELKRESHFMGRINFKVNVHHDFWIPRTSLSYILRLLSIIIKPFPISLLQVIIKTLFYFAIAGQWSKWWLGREMGLQINTFISLNHSVFWIQSQEHLLLHWDTLVCKFTSSSNAHLKI